MLQPDTPRKLCLAVPIHKPYFLYGVNLAYSSIKADYDVVFVFSSKADADDFAKLIPVGGGVRYQGLTIDTHYTGEELQIILDKRISPTVKKFFALDALKHRYDYIVCVDAETVILQRTGWLDRARQIMAQRDWVGGVLRPEMSGERRIMTASFFESAEIQPDIQQAILNLLGPEELIYTWWWDLPVYDCRHLEGFLSWIRWGERRHFLDKVSWFSFDHIVYQLFTVLYHQFRFKKVGFHAHSLEFSRSQTVEMIFKQVGPVAWVNAYAYSQNPEFYERNGVLAYYHIDRAQFPDYNP